MKKRLLLTVVLALCLITLSPTVALAASPTTFNTQGAITGIDTGTIIPIGDSGQCLIFDRHMWGTVFGSINGDFILTYSGKVDMATQAGNIHGIIQSGDYSMTMSAASAPLDIVWFAPLNTYLPKLSANGNFTFVKGAKGQGTLSADIVFIPDGIHVGQIVASSIALTGKWHLKSDNGNGRDW